MKIIAGLNLYKIYQKIWKSNKTVLGERWIWVHLKIHRFPYVCKYIWENMCIHEYTWVYVSTRKYSGVHISMHEFRWVTTMSSSEDTRTDKRIYMCIHEYTIRCMKSRCRRMFATESNNPTFQLDCLQLGHYRTVKTRVAMRSNCFRAKATTRIWTTCNLSFFQLCHTRFVFVFSFFIVCLTLLALQSAAFLFSETEIN